MLDFFFLFVHIQLNTKALQKIPENENEYLFRGRKIQTDTDKLSNFYFFSDKCLDYVKKKKTLRFSKSTFEVPFLLYSVHSIIIKITLYNIRPIQTLSYCVRIENKIGSEFTYLLLTGLSIILIFFFVCLNQQKEEKKT